MSVDPEKLKQLLQSDEVQKAVAERAERDAREAETIEEAPWFGTTGLGEALERELPRYLRRELGESIFEKGSLKASDLRYLGVFPAKNGPTHFWRLSFAGEPTYAYAEPWGGEDFCLGWGNMEPDGDA